MALNPNKMYPLNVGTDKDPLYVSTVTNEAADASFSFTKEDDPFKKFDDNMGGTFADILDSTGTDTNTNTYEIGSNTNPSAGGNVWDELENLLQTTTTDPNLTKQLSELKQRATRDAALLLQRKELL